MKKLDDMTVPAPGQPATKDGTLTERLAHASAEDMQSRIDALEAENAKLKGEFQRATDAARSNAVLLSQWQEVEAGISEPDEDGRTQQLWEYTIDLALNGGEGLKINGRVYYHGQTYIFTTDELRTIKDMIFRTHVHEMNVFGHQNENFYRHQSNRSITTGRAVNM